MIAEMYDAMLAETAERIGPAFESLSEPMRRLHRQIFYAALVVFIDALSGAMTAGKEQERAFMFDALHELEDFYDEGN